MASAQAAAPEPHKEIFRPADHIINARFEAEAARIAQSVELPMVTFPPSFGSYGR